MATKEEMLIFKLREKKQPAKQPQAEPPAAAPAQQAEPQAAPPAQPQPAYAQPQQAAAKPQQERRAQRYIPEEEPEVLVTPAPSAFKQVEEAEMLTQRHPKSTKYEKKSKKAAEGLFCTWHPWRSAYSVCAECHRPFCYEDIIEYSGKYYCLEDIDSVAAHGGIGPEFVYNKVSLVSAGAFLSIIVVYLYFSYGQLLYLFNYANHIGLNTFLTKLNITYITVLFSAILILFNFISAMLIFAQSKKGYGFGILSGFLSITLFSYEFINSYSLYTAIISALSFASLISLGYSRSGYEPMETGESVIAREPSAYDWPNVGRF